MEIKEFRTSKEENKNRGIPELDRNLIRLKRALYVTSFFLLLLFSSVLIIFETGELETATNLVILSFSFVVALFIFVVIKQLNAQIKEAKHERALTKQRIDHTL